MRRIISAIAIVAFVGTGVPSLEDRDSPGQSSLRRLALSLSQELAPESRFEAKAAVPLSEAELYALNLFTEAPQLVMNVYDSTIDPDIQVAVFRSEKEDQIELVAVNVNERRLVAKAFVEMREGKAFSQEIGTIVEGFGYMQRAITLLLLNGSISEWNSTNDLEDGAKEMYGRMANDPRLLVKRIGDEDVFCYRVTVKDAQGDDEAGRLFYELERGLIEEVLNGLRSGDDREIEGALKSLADDPRLLRKIASLDSGQIVGLLRQPALHNSQSNKIKNLLLEVLYELEGISKDASVKEDRQQLQSTISMQERARYLFGDGVVGDFDLEFDFQRVAEGKIREICDSAQPNREHSFTPDSIVLLPTNRCVVGCSHCLFSAGRAEAPSEGLGKETIGKIFANIPWDGIKGCFITGGGEPLLQRDITETIKAVPYPVGVTTSAVIFNRKEDAVKFLRGLGEKKKETFFSISLDEFHLQATPQILERICNLLEAIHEEEGSMCPEIRLARFLQEDEKTRPIELLKQQLELRGYVVEPKATSYGETLVISKDGRSTNVNIYMPRKEGLDRFGRALFLPDRYFWGGFALKRIPMNKIRISAEGEVAFNEALAISPVPFSFGNIKTENWERIKERIERDSIFNELISNRGDITRILSFAKEYDPSTQAALSAKLHSASEFLYWSLINPRRRLYVTLRILQECSKQGSTLRSLPYGQAERPLRAILSMSNSELRGYVNRSIREVEENYRWRVVDVHGKRLCISKKASDGMRQLTKSMKANGGSVEIGGYGLTKELGYNTIMVLDFIVPQEDDLIVVVDKVVDTTVYRERVREEARRQGAAANYFMHFHSLPPKLAGRIQSSSLAERKRYFMMLCQFSFEGLRNAHRRGVRWLEIKMLGAPDDPFSKKKTFCRFYDMQDIDRLAARIKNGVLHLTIFSTKEEESQLMRRLLEELAQLFEELERKAYPSKEMLKYALGGPDVVMMLSHGSLTSPLPSRRALNAIFESEDPSIGLRQILSSPAPTPTPTERLDKRSASGSALAPGSRFGVRDEIVRRKARLIADLKDEVGNPRFRSAAATQLAGIVCKHSNDPELVGLAMDALEDLLVSDDLFLDGYNAVANGIADVARKSDASIRPSTLKAAETFLEKRTIEERSHNDYDVGFNEAKHPLHAGIKLVQAIVWNRVDLAEAGTIKAIKEYLMVSGEGERGLIPVIRDGVWEAACTLESFVGARRDLTSQAIDAFRDVLMAKDMGLDACEIVAGRLASIVVNHTVDTKASEQALDTLEHVLNNSLYDNSRLAVADALRSIVNDKLRLIRPSTLFALRNNIERGEKAEDFGRHAAMASFQGAALAKHPGLFSQEGLFTIMSCLGLRSIHLAEGGNASDTTSAFAEGLLSNLGRLRLKKLPRDFPTLKSLERRDMATIMSLEEFLPKGCTFVRAAGRTLIYRKPDGKYLALKFLKSSERGEEGILQYESESFDWMNENKETYGFKSAYPKSYLFEGKRVVRVEDIGQAKDCFGKHVDTEGNKVEIDRSYSHYTFMAYEADESYFRYLNGEDVSEEEFLEGSRRCIHDLFTLARHGIMHTSLIELFHNVIQRGREDGGRYLWMVGIMREFGGRSGAGMIHAWDAEVRYPNLRVSGAADLAELGLLYNIAEPGNRFNPFPKKGVLAPKIKQRFGNNTEHIYLASYLGDYLLAYALVIGDYYKKKGKLDWRKPEELAASMREAFSQSLCVFMETDEGKVKPILDTIDFTKLARQMAFFMSGEYKNYVDKDIPEEIFGIRGLRIIPGDGWGHIHQSIIEEAIGSKEEGVIGRYFKIPVSTGRRQMPGDVFIFKPDFESLIETEESAELRTALKALHAKYSRGWRFDGIHEDLGPINGPLALQELIKALYVTTSLMVFDASEKPRSLPKPAALTEDLIPLRVAM